MTYTIVSGDTMGTIAAKFLGSSTRYKEIIALNPQIADPNILQIGQVINVPNAVIASPSTTADPLPTPPPSNSSQLLDKIKLLLQNKKLLAGIGAGIILLMYLNSRKSKK